jgi:flagellar L-ring protein precursor FlgH
VGRSWFGIERAACAALLALADVGASGCGAMYLSGTPRIDRPEIAATAPTTRQQQTGSLWRDNVSANYLFTDVKAHFPGDLLTVLVVEDSSGSKAAATSTTTDTSVFGNLTEFFGLPQQLAAKNPDINPAALLSAEAQREWDGEGTTTRTGRLTARITVQVTAVDANGNLWVEGEKVVAVNREDQHIVVNGLVRPEDVNAANEVLSTRLALGKVEYYGVGVVATKQHPGWGRWILDWVWPF